MFKPDSLNFDELKAAIQQTPMTYLPALLLIMVETAYKKQVFQKGGASRMVKQLEKKLGEDK